MSRPLLLFFRALLYRTQSWAWQPSTRRFAEASLVYLIMVPGFSIWGISGVVEYSLHYKFLGVQEAFFRVISTMGHHIETLFSMVKI